ncbi:MAG: VWA domain-containing protein, partial [Ardenticatenales bacterium]
SLDGGFVPQGLLLDTRRLDADPTAGSDYLQQPRWIGNDPSLIALRDVALHRPSGNLYILGGGEVFCVRPNGTIVQRFTLPPIDRGATRLAVLNDGRILIARPLESSIAAYLPDGTTDGILAVLDAAPAALSVGQDGSLHVLIQSRNSVDPGQTLIVSLSDRGVVLDKHAAAALGAPPLPAIDWPWSLDAPANDQFALTSGDEHFTTTVHRGSGAQPPLLVGAPVTATWTPGPAPYHADDDLVITQGPESEVFALDRRDARILAYSSDGAVRFVTDVPPDAHDLAVGPGGAEDLYITTTGDEVLRLDPGGVPRWQVPCDCHLGGRIAAGGGSVYVTQPRARRIRVLNALSGATEREYSLPGTALWPYDVTWQSGFVYATDMIETRIQSFPPPPLVSTDFPAGLLAGPRLVARARISGDGPLAIDALAAVMADGWVEIHDPNAANLIARFRPLLSNETPLFPSDIAAGLDTVYLADAARRAIQVFGAGAGIPATPSVPTTTPTPAAESCTVTGDKRAEPAQVVEGDSAQVTLNLRARCPDRARLIGADIVLVIDRSLSMRGAPLEAARGAARSFAELLDVRYHRLGLTSFASEATMDYGLTDDVATVIDHLEGLQADGGTNISAGLDRAGDNLSRFGRVDALPVIVLLTDGRHNPDTTDPVQTAVGLRARGVQIFTIGLGPNVDAPALGAIAGVTDRVFLAPTPSDLFPIYRQVLRVVVDSLAGNVVLDDTLSDRVTLVDGSVSPPARPLGRKLQWGRSILPASGVTMTYLVRPIGPGCMATNEQASAEYTDADGARRTFTFPVPTICVVTPSPTPTLTPSPTPTPTEVPKPVFLPLTYRNFCKPVAAGVDVVLLIDTSDSMTGPKLDQAKRAARVFVGELPLDTGDRAAVIGFDSDARVAAQLSGDRAALERAIDGLASGTGTRIDRALQAAERELNSPRHIANHRAAAVLLSDGRQSGPTSIVDSAAAQLRLVPALIFTIGLGDGADTALLRSIAGDARRYFYAPGPNQLEGIYRTIAEVIPCP